MAFGVDGCARHGTPNWHGKEEAVDYVGDAKVIQLLTLIDRIAILASECLAYCQVFESTGD